MKTTFYFLMMISIVLLIAPAEARQSDACTQMVEQLLSQLGLESFYHPGSCAKKDPRFNSSEVTYPTLKSGPKIRYNPTDKILDVTLADDPVSGASIRYNFVFDSSCTKIKNLSAGGFLGRPGVSLDINKKNCAQNLRDERSSDYDKRTLAFTAHPICETFGNLLQGDSSNSVVNDPNAAP